MSETSYKAVLCQDGQITIPLEVIAALALREGDQLELTLENNGVLVKSRKQAARDLLAKIGKGFAESGILRKSF